MSDNKTLQEKISNLLEEISTLNSKIEQKIKPKPKKETIFLCMKKKLNLIQLM